MIFQHSVSPHYLAAPTRSLAESWHLITSITSIINITNMQSNPNQPIKQSSSICDSFEYLPCPACEPCLSQPRLRPAYALLLLRLSTLIDLIG
jgi:hypothetical protein